MKHIATLTFVALVFAGCNANQQQSNNNAPAEAQSDNSGVVQPAEPEAPAQSTQMSEADIESIVDQLVFADGDAQGKPVFSPGITDDSEAYRKRFEACQTAFQRLSELKDLAFPVLIKHLDDKRQSINFRNHHMGNSVGHACYWNIYFQLQDRPRGYSRYGYSREGRDGEDHPKPYWEGSPFDDAGGLREWLTANENLNYQEKQIKCLNWLLEREKRIGAADAESYFINILPLEIQIFKRRLEKGDDVETELKRLRKIQTEELADQVPKELLPD